MRDKFEDLINYLLDAGDLILFGIILLMLVGIAMGPLIFWGLE